MALKPKTEPAPQGDTLPMQTRMASVRMAGDDAESRTVEVIWTTGASVRRYDWREGEWFDEELVVSDNAVDLTRMNNAAPLLEQHNAWSLDSVLGVVERSWIKAGTGYATVRFPAAGLSEKADRVLGLIRDKVLRNLSAGYVIRKVERIVEDGKTTVWRVVDWQPYELSIVAVGADDGAKTRSEPSAVEHPLIIHSRAAPVTQKETGMPKPNPVEPVDPVVDTRVIEPTPAPAAAPVAPAPAAPQARAWTAAEMGKIHTRARAFGLTAEDAFAVIGEAESVEAATDALQARAAKAATPRQRPQVEIITDEGDVQRAAVENAILHRANPNAAKLTDAGRAWRGMTLLEMGRTFVEDVQGIRLRGIDKRELAGVLLGLDHGQRAGGLSSGDFPNLLANVASKRMRDAYGSAVQTFKPFCRQSNAPDFKERAIVQMSGIPELKQVREGAEYTYAKLGDAVEKYSLATFGRIIAITRQTLINDDLGAFDRLPSLFGRAAANFESDLVWGVITGSHVMGDGIELFHADHGNLAGAGAVPSEATLEAGELALGGQKGADGTALNLRPKFLAVSPKHKIAAQKMLTSVAQIKTGDVNVYQNAMDLIVEQRLAPASGAAPWLMIADPNDYDTIEYAYLEGEAGLYTEQRSGFTVDGIEVKGRLDFAAKAIDHRGFFKNPGT